MGCYYICMPVLRMEDLEAPGQPKPGDLKMEMMKDNQFKILVVDDEEPMREICSEVLSSAGYGVATASDGWEALGLLDSNWDLVITDVNMPGLDGMELFKAAERRFPGVGERFFFMTGDKSSAASVEAMNLRLIKKPFKVKDLLDAVEAALREQGVSRKDKRVRVEGHPLHISIDGIEMDAFAEDLSLNGMKIRYAGKPFEAGPGLRILIDGLNISREARVIWSSPSAGTDSYSGVIFESPVPMTVISELVPGSL